MNRANKLLESNNEDKLWDNAFKYFSSKYQSILVQNNQILCKKIIELTKTKILKKKTGPYRTMYRLEYLIFWYFENKINKTESLKDKNILNNQRRYTIKVINQELDTSQNI